ncbi:hypothetical protein RYX36_007613 [Vicia faba]
MSLRLIEIPTCFAGIESLFAILALDQELAVPEKIPSLQASYNWHIHHLNDSRRFTARESKQENDTKQAIILNKWSLTA